MSTSYTTSERIDQPTERIVFDALGNLDDEWHVFHSVSWIAVGRDPRADGEADFVLFHRDRGMIVLEVKGGDIDLNHGVWSVIRRHGELRPIKDPLTQVKDNAYSLKRHLVREMSNAGLGLGYAIVVPAAADSIKAKAGELGSILWTAADLRDVNNAVEGLCRIWKLNTGVDPALAEAVIGHLAPTVSVSRSSREATLLAETELEEATRREILLTEEQIKLLADLRGKRRAIVYGRAGTGKTLMALARAQQLADEGARVLLTCSRSALASTLRLHAAQQLPSSLRRQYPPNSFRYDVPNDYDASPLVIESFKALIRALVPESDRKLVQRLGDGAIGDGSVGVDDVGHALALRAAPFDATVVDEGQQFPPLWFRILANLMMEHDDSPLYVFADPLQAFVPLRADREAWRPPFADPSFFLTVNCRNTFPIMNVLAGVADFEAPKLGVPGPPVRLVEVASGRGWRNVLVELILDLLDEGHYADDITVVTLAGAGTHASDDLAPGEVSRMRARRLVALLAADGRLPRSIRVSGLTPPVVSQHSSVLRVASSREFQGFESPVVVVLAGAALSEGDRRRVMREAYIAMSRARALLVVIASPEMAELVRANAPGMVQSKRVAGPPAR